MGQIKVGFRRVSPIAVRPGEGLLTGPTAAVGRRQRFDGRYCRTATGGGQTPITLAYHRISDPAARPGFRVLCPMNRGGVGDRSLNIELQAGLNPAGERKLDRFGWTFAPGDKIMQIENEYDKDVCNGDIGYIEDVDPDAGELTASFDGGTVTYGFGELDTLVPAYAATIHKSQGSEYPAVVIPILTQHYAMLQRNLLYTGVTRGKRLVVLVGQKTAVAIAVRNVSGRRRGRN
jgi:ATP-dependent exoDNAse (exonuclease V) alpha subunit